MRVVIWVWTCVRKFYPPETEQDWREIHSVLTLLTSYSFPLTGRGLLALCSFYNTSFVHSLFYFVRGLFDTFFSLLNP